MITTIRKKFSKNFLNKILIIILALSYLGIFSLPILLRESSLPWSIKVNGDTISSKLFTQTVEEQRNLIAQFRSLHGQFADLFLKSIGAMDPQLLASTILIQHLLLNQLAKSLSLFLNHNYVVEQMNNYSFVQNYLSEIIPLFLFDKNGEINQTILRSYLQRRDISIATLTHLVEQALQRHLLQELLEQTFYLPNFDARAIYWTTNASKKFSILTVSYDSFLKQEKLYDVSDELLQSFFEEQNSQQRYLVPEKRDVILWQFKPENYGITISEEDIDAYYNENKMKQYSKTPAQVSVCQIIYKQDSEHDKSLVDIRNELIENPDLFEEYARTYSDDETAKKGGFIELFSRGTHEEAFEKAAFALQNKGDISTIIQTTKGMALLQLIQKNPRSYIPLDEVKESIRSKLISDFFTKKFNRDMKKIVGQDVLDQGSLNLFIRERGGIQESHEQLVRSDGTVISNAAFRLHKKGDVTFYCDKTVGTVIMLSNVTKKYVPELDTIKKTVLFDYHDNAARKNIMKTLEIIAQRSKNEDLEMLAQEFKAHFEQTDWISPDNSKKIKELEKRDIPADKILQLEKNGFLQFDQTRHGGYVVQLDEIEPFDEIRWQTHKKAEISKIEQSHASLFIKGVIASLQRNATIEMNELNKAQSEEYPI